MKKNMLRHTIMAMSLAIMPFTAFASEKIEDINDLEAVPNHVMGGIAFDYLSPHFLLDVELVSRDMRQAVSINLGLRLDEIIDLLIRVNPKIKTEEDATNVLKHIVLEKCVSRATTVRDIHEIEKALLYKKLFKLFSVMDQSALISPFKVEHPLIPIPPKDINHDPDNLEITKLAFAKFSDSKKKYIVLPYQDNALTKKYLHLLEGICEVHTLFISGHFTLDSLLKIQKFISSSRVEERFTHFCLTFQNPLSDTPRQEAVNFDASETDLSAFFFKRKVITPLTLVPPSTLTVLHLTGVSFENDDLKILCHSLEKKGVRLRGLTLLQNDIHDNDLQTLLPIIKPRLVFNLNNPISQKGFQFLKTSIGDPYLVLIRRVVPSLLTYWGITDTSHNYASKKRDAKAIVQILNKDTDLKFF